MLLSALIGPEIVAPVDMGAIEIASLTADSRKASPGTLFAALSGTHADGARFIGDAVSKGAVAVLAATDAALPPGLAVPILRTHEPRRALALMASRFYGQQPATVVAVTGTSGKTSVAEFTRQIFAACGKAAASVGTIGVVKPSGAVSGSLTTPDPGLPPCFAGVVGGRGRHPPRDGSLVARPRPVPARRCPLDGRRITNLGRDHMDYHPTVDSYLAAKLRLFNELLKPGQPIVVNTDGARSDDVIAAARDRGLTRPHRRFARRSHPPRRRCPRRLQAAPNPRDPGGRARCSAAPGRCLSGRERPRRRRARNCRRDTAAEAVAALGHLEGVPGRLDIVGEARGGLAVVDYAHKPEALAAALDACRPFVTGRLICVFGCGGDRDRGKRPIMGRDRGREWPISPLSRMITRAPRSQLPSAPRSSPEPPSLGASPARLATGPKRSGPLLP